jgi:Tol biopolymer transport system component
VARERDRLAFTRTNADADIHRFVPGRPSTAVVATSFPESMPRLSPDGRRMAFLGANAEVWVAGADGSGPQALTDGPGRIQNSPSWSPDGRRIAFDSRSEDDRFDIWVIDAEGGTPRRLTPHAGEENVPSWSRDGRWIYFTSDRGGAGEIWRIPAEGGREEQLTLGGAGFGVRETEDGRTLLFKRGLGDSPLLALPLAGGAERTLVGCVRGSTMDGGFDVAGGAVYYADCGRPDPSLHRLDLASGRDEVLGTLERYGGSGTIAASADGRIILYDKITGEGSDLMLIEGFR